MSNTGGPAFPGVDESGDPFNGMTMRDYFAAKAMQGIFAGAKPDYFINLRGVSEWAYNMADAMLMAREVSK